MSSVIVNKHKLLDWKVDGFKKPWLSRKYRATPDGHITHDLRCDICGKWYNYSTKDIKSIVWQGRWNDKTNRPHHCGSEHCQNYFELECAHRAKAWQQATDIAKMKYPFAKFKV